MLTVNVAVVKTAAHAATGLLMHERLQDKQRVASMRHTIRGWS
jgi:hypothetical protein